MRRLNGAIGVCILSVALGSVAACGRDAPPPTTPASPAGQPAANTPPVETLDFTKLLSMVQTQEEWLKVMRPYDGRLIRFVGCFSGSSFSLVKGHPELLLLLPCKFQYFNHGRFFVTVAEVEQRIAVHFRGPPPVITYTDCERFAVTGIFRIGEVRPDGIRQAYGSVECEKFEELHGIPVGPTVEIPAADVESVTMIAPQEWNEYVDPNTGARGQRLNEGKVQGIEYLLVVAKGDGRDFEKQVYPMRPGGYFTRSDASLRIVPDPSE